MTQTRRRAAVALTVLPAAGLLLTGCGTPDGPAGKAASAETSVTSSPAALPATPLPSGSARPAAATGKPSAPAAGPASIRTPGARPSLEVPVITRWCSAAALAVSDAYRVEPTNPDATYAVDLSLTNTGGARCTLQGFPTVAIAGEGDPTRSKPLTVVTQGTAQPVPLSPGNRAWVRLTFRQVLGEADGYCASGADPATPPSIVLGVADGRHQVGLDGGGNFAECDDIVRTTAFLPARP